MEDQVKATNISFRDFEVDGLVLTGSYDDDGYPIQEIGKVPVLEVNWTGLDGVKRALHGQDTDEAFWREYIESLPGE